jgi:hypothetical protein
MDCISTWPVNKAQLVTITVMRSRVPQAASLRAGLFHGIHSLAEVVIISSFREHLAMTTTYGGAGVDKPSRNEKLDTFLKS